MACFVEIDIWHKYHEWYFEIGHYKTRTEDYVGKNGANCSR